MKYMRRRKGGNSESWGNVWKKDLDNSVLAMFADRQSVAQQLRVLAPHFS